MKMDEMDVYYPEQGHLAVQVDSLITIAIKYPPKSSGKTSQQCETAPTSQY